MKKEVKTLGTILIAVVAVFVLAALFYQRSSSGPDTTDGKDMSRLVREDSPSLGPEDASVTLVEFLDPECESCMALHPYVKEILREFEGEIRFVVRYMSYHSNSHGAAVATEAAGLQSKYWDMHDLLFERQEEWGHQPTPQTEKFIEYAGELGLDIDKFREALDRPELAQKVRRDHQDGDAIGVRGTPSFYVNGQPLERLDPYELRRMIAKALGR